MLAQSPWKLPDRYGYGEAVQSAGTIVAPLLAGFTITLIGLVVDKSNGGIRYRNLALLALTVAAALLLAAVQCAYSARQYLVTPDEVAAWWPGLADADIDDPLVLERRVEQRAHGVLHSCWARRFRVVYNAGVVLVLVGLAIVLVPPGPVSTTRALAIAIAVLAAFAEAAWVAATIGARRDGALGRASRRVVPSYDAERALARVDIPAIDAARAKMAAAKAERRAQQSAAPPATPPTA